MNTPTPRQLQKLVRLNIIRFREEQEMTQGDLARRAGIDRKTVNRIENEQFSPNICTLASIARAQNHHPTEYFVRWMPNKKRSK